MKKHLLIAAAAIAAAGIARAAEPDELRIYVNPGHGSWTGNDRPMQLITHPREYSATATDTTGFFESNTNLEKGFGVLEALINMGFAFDRSLNQTGERWQIGAAKDLEQSVVMSRVKNGPFESNNVTSSPNYMLYNRSLSEIAREAQSNDFDMFISIHSNAANAVTTNYHLFMYKGKNGRANVVNQGSYEMAEAASIYSFANEHAAWSETYTYINGDIDFMHINLGALNHTVPGYLVEGYFHTYGPGRHRGMNWDVDREEGAAYARGVAEYFGFEREKTGDIYGIVRDMHNKFSHQFYTPRTNSMDRFKPLNGCKVILNKDGNKIAEYTTDRFYNGAFVFRNLQPGDYTLDFEHPEYHGQQGIEVTVVPGNCVYPKVFLEDLEWVQPTDFTETYPDQLDEKCAFGAADRYAFDRTYVDNAIAPLEGKNVTRTVVRGTKLYALAYDDVKNPTIVVYDLEAKKVLAEVSTQGMAGTELPVGDIQVTADGILVASNKEKVHSDDGQIQAGDPGRGTLRFYKWQNNVDGIPEGDPEQFASTQQSGLWYRSYAGGTFAYFGTIDDGTISVSAPTITAPNYELRTMEITVADGKGVATTVHKPRVDGARLSTPAAGNYQFVASANDGRDVWIMTEKMGVIEYSNDTPEGDTECKAQSGNAMPKNMLGASAFRYAGHAYVAVPTNDGAGNNTGIEVYDVTQGIAKATPVTTDNTALDALAAQGHTGAWVKVTRNKDTNAVESADISLYDLRGAKVSRMTTATATQPALRNAYAHGLKATGKNGGYGLEYSFSSDAESAEIILTPVGGGNEIVIPVADASAGSHETTVSLADLEDEKEYTWAVKTYNKAVAYAGINAQSAHAIKNNSRGGLAWIADPQSPAFGKLVVSHGYAQGITVYNPDMTTAMQMHKPDGNEWVSTKINSPYRMAQKDGCVYICDWSDPSAGYWFFDPANHATTHNVLGGERDKTSGAHTHEGNIIGGSSTSIAFQGTGADTRMLSFVEDYPTGNTTLKLVRYHIGEEPIWCKAPEKVFDISGDVLMTGTNVELLALEDGMFVSQVRAEGGNTVTSPAFIYIDNNGQVLFNSSTLDVNLTSGGSGMALNADRTVMAIAENTTGIGIWDVEWANGVPSFTKRYIIPGSAGSAEVSQMAFDQAGNLYAFHRSNFGMRAYSVRGEASDNTTAAPAGLLLSSLGGVQDITADNDANAPVVYYNLQGMRVAADALTPGVYVKTQGRKSTKVIIR